jgi:hypothetical protein
MQGYGFNYLQVQHIGVGALGRLEFQPPSTTVELRSQPLMEIALLMGRGIILLMYHRRALCRTSDGCKGVVCRQNYVVGIPLLNVESPGRAQPHNDL